jgi:hypothetical protein
VFVILLRDGRIRVGGQSEDEDDELLSEGDGDLGSMGGSGATVGRCSSGSSVPSARALITALDNDERGIDAKDIVDGVLGGGEGEDRGDGGRVERDFTVFRATMVIGKEWGVSVVGSSTVGGGQFNGSAGPL